MTRTNSILDGIPPLVDEWLDLTCRGQRPLYRHKSAALELSKRSTIASAEQLFKTSYQQIDQNWKKAVSENRYSRSGQNWRFEKRTEISKANNSPEVIAERAIVSSADSHWANQIPTSSGLVGSSSDKTRNIDLVCRDDEQNYQLIELKIAGNNPLYAAIEILLNGLLLAWSRNNADALGYDEKNQPLLFAKSIQLATLAPGDYYKRFDLTALSSAIGQGLESCQDLLEIPFTFQFTQFGPGFTPGCSDQEMYQYALSREPIWSPGK